MDSMFISLNEIRVCLSYDLSVRIPCAVGQGRYRDIKLTDTQRNFDLEIGHKWCIMINIYFPDKCVHRYN